MQGSHVWLSFSKIPPKPFAHPDAVPVMNELAETCKVFVMTNGYWLKEIESVLDDRVALLVAWHPSQVKFEDFYWGCRREKTNYFYVLHPASMENGMVERHFAMFESLVSFFQL
jgi:hypothetical protein